MDTSLRWLFYFYCNLNSAIFCFPRRQESSFSFEDVSKWHHRLTEEIILLGTQIHGPMGDSSFRLGDVMWCDVMWRDVVWCGVVLGYSPIYLTHFPFSYLNSASTLKGSVACLVFDHRCFYSLCLLLHTLTCPFFDDFALHCSSLSYRLISVE